MSDKEIERQKNEDWAKQLSIERAAYEQEKGPELHLIAKLDSLKSNWYIWSCTRNGVEGTIQADSTGELIAYETFEKD